MKDISFQSLLLQTALAGDIRIIFHSKQFHCDTEPGLSILRLYPQWYLCINIKRSLPRASLLGGKLPPPTWRGVPLCSGPRRERSGPEQVDASRLANSPMLSSTWSFRTILGVKWTGRTQARAPGVRCRFSLPAGPLVALRTLPT